MIAGRRSADIAWAGPVMLGPVLAAVSAALLFRVLGPISVIPVVALALVAALVLTGLLRFDLIFSGYLFYLLFETVLAGFLSPQLALLSKDLGYLGVVGLGLLVAVVGGSRAESARPAPGTVPVLLFLVLHILLMLRGPTMFVGALGLRTTAYLCFIAVLAPMAYEKASARRISLAMLALGLIVVASVGLWEFMHWQEVRESLQLEDQRWSMGTLKAGSTVGSPGALGAIMALGLLFIVSWVLEGGLSRAAWSLAVLVGGACFVGLVVSFSRVSQFGFVAGLLYLLLRRPRLLVPGVLALGVAALVANALTEGFLFGNLLASFGIGEHLDAIQSGIDRVDIVRETLQERVPRRPWLGYGLGSSGPPTRTHIDVAPFGYLFLDNLYLKALLEGGVLGLVGYVGLLLGLIISGVRGGAGLLRRIENLGAASPDGGVASLRTARACVRASVAAMIFFAIIGMASTVTEMPVVNAAFWWCAGWILWAGARLRDSDAAPG